MSGSASGATPEHELALHLMGTRAARAERAARIAELARSAHQPSLVAALASQRILALAGTRLETLCGEYVSPELADAVVAQRDATRRGALAFEQATSTAVGVLERSGIRALPLKGVVLAERAHGDQSLRALPADVDILVDRDRLHDACGKLASAGWGEPEDHVWEQGLPLLHYTLPPRAPWLPPLELHWRTHWGGERFARELLRHSRPDAQHGRVAEPEWELAALLLFYARDSFAGLRLLGDLTAWWDARSAQLAPDGLASVVAAHPELALALRGAALAADQLGGVPARDVLGAPLRPGRRIALAVRLADWPQSCETEAEAAANLASVELLLTPARGLVPFLRRNMFQPAAVLAERYGSRPDAWLESRVRRVVRGTARLLRFGPRFARAAWQAQRGHVPRRLPA